MDNETNYWVCVDCASFIANGETPAEFDEVATEAWIAEFERQRGDRRWGWGHSHADCDHGEFDDDERTECETREFSWSPCDACDSSLGGSRHAAHLFSV